MDIDILKEVLEQQFENNNIKRGSKRAHEFEYAFLMGVLATAAAQNEAPHPLVTILLGSGRSLFELGSGTREVH